ncbi:non-ribosomal peptide synthetase/type I polyketide synthase [Pseudomonas sp. MWU16-30316]|uniref:hybrid non-ribosomal peptide synthetase/type I polyketide synthase n=1 Tax=Pseudomonas sp. MWU16-30316 TaxID=2878093 RepID=UPI001CF88300|nr:non-ribosomal peptide synthetase/type I polyketide synthase [Pseudomonas sp. MWU16-30316]
MVMSQKKTVTSTTGSAVRSPTPAARGFLNLSPAQKSLWFMHQMEDASATYNVPFALRIDGALDCAALERAVDSVYQRQTALRYRFPCIDGQPVIRLVNEQLLTRKVDLRAEPDSEAALKAFEQSEARYVFDLEHEALLRATLLHCATDEHVLLINVHHIIFDGWSMQIFLSEVASAYSALVQGSEVNVESLNFDFGDYLSLSPSSAERDPDIAHWKQRLAGAPPVLPLPLDDKRPAVQRYAGQRCHFQVPAAVSDSLKKLAKDCRVTPYMVGLAAFSVLLYRYTQEADLVIGSPMSNRQSADLEGVIGFFVNTLPNRIDASGSPSFVELLKRVRASVLDTFEHAHVPFDQIVEAIQPPRSLSHAPVFQVLFDMANEDFSVELENLRTRVYTLDSCTAKYDLSLTLALTARGMSGAVEYDTALLDETAVQGMIDSLLIIMEQVSRNPDGAIDDFSLLSDEAVEQALRLANHQPAAPQAPFAPFHQWFKCSAAQWGEMDALIYADRRYSYAQLDAEARVLAGHLHAAGVRHGDRIAVVQRYGPEVIVALLAVHQVGGIYVPLAIDDARHADLLKDIEPRLVLTLRAFQKQLQDYPCLLQDDLPQTTGTLLESEFEGRNTQPEDIAYIIFTSGSTGRPKGVSVSHGSWVSLLQALEQTYGQTEPGVTGILQMANFTFDVFMSDVVRALAVGARLIMCPRQSLADPERLYELITAERVTLLEFVPAVLRQMIRYLEETARRLDTLHTLTCGADVWFVHEYRKMQTLCGPHTRVVSVYGVTEATCESATFEPDAGWYDSERSLPIGGPLPNTSLYLVDATLNLVPRTVPGELLIGGGAVASGYMNRPELNEKSFLTGSFSASGRFLPGIGKQRFYRTGDLCRHMRDGTIEFLGRSDNQVKIRGFRIELGEVESVLADHPDVSECAVVTRQSPGAEAELIGYVQTRATAQQLNAYLGERLPGHMVPRLLVVLPALPLTANGKIDRKSLPEPDWAQDSRAYAAPRNSLEEQLVEDWQQLLNVPRIGIDDNFFESGGHSLLVTQVIAHIKKRFGVALSIANLFEGPTVAQVAEKIMLNMIQIAQGASVASRPAAIGRSSGIERQRLSFAQRRLWLTQHSEPGTAYNMPEICRLTGQLDIPALEGALNLLLERHEVLRTHFTCELETFVDAQGLTQKEPLVVTSHADSARVPFRQQKIAREALSVTLEREVHTPFLLDKELPIRAVLLQTASDEYVLCLTLHHIAYDGWSSALLRQELAAFYRHLTQGECLRLSALEAQYQDYAAWQRNQLESGAFEAQLDAWKASLKDLPPPLVLPVRSSPRAGNPLAGDYVALTLPGDCSARLDQLCLRLQCTPAMVMHAAFALLLHRYTGQDDILIGMPFSGRDHDESANLIGFFVNLLPLRLRLRGPLRVAQVIEQSRQALLAAEANHSVPIDYLAQVLNPQRLPGKHPFFQVGLVVQSTTAVPLTLPYVQSEEISLASTEVKLDLMLELRAVKGEGVSGVFKYRTSLFERSVISGMAEHFQCLLENMLANAEQTVAQVKMLPATEHQRLISQFNDTSRDFGDGDIVSRFEQRVRQTPQAMALQLQQRCWTYAELDRLANGIAHALIKKGVQAGEHIGLFTGRHPYLVAGMLGILKARCAFVPLNPQDSMEGALGYMIKDAALRRVVGHQGLAHELAALGLETLLVDDFEGAEGEWSAPACQREPQDLAYILYTSGSTGQPKGVMVSQRNIDNTANAFARALELNAQSRQLQYFSPVFDGVCGEVFPVLISGATLVFAASEQLLPGPDLVTLLREQRITHLQITPTALRLLPHAELAELKVIISAGEACPANVAQTWATGRRFLNGYGPTETTVYASAQDYWDERGALVLRPLDNVRMYVLDPYLNPLPCGVPGELYIGGNGVAQGYLNLDERTAQAFLPDPYGVSPEARLYRTGDFVVRQFDGSLSYVGRIDNQVKVRGFRIELGDVEARLNAIVGLEQAVVVVKQDDHEHKILVGYYVGKPSIAQVRAELAKVLPTHMVPERLICLPELPLSRTGKVDRKALENLVDQRAQEGTAVGKMPTSPAVVRPAGKRLHNKVRKIWQEVLDCQEIDSDDNFFDLGGHSLRIVETQKRLSELLQAPVAMTDLFEYPTLRGLVAHLERLHGPLPEVRQASEASPAIDPGNRTLAVVGMAGRFPGAADLSEFWQNLTEGVESTLYFSDEVMLAHGVSPDLLERADFVKCGNRLEDVDKFDAEFFGFSPREAQLMDPQQRIFLQCAWTAMEAAGYGGSLNDLRVGVFASASTSHYLLDHVYPRRQELQLENIQWLLGNGRDFMASRVAYKLNLAGPAITVETACSSSLVAVQMACESLLRGESDMVIVGGASVEAQYYGYQAAPGSIISADGHCRPFDAQASGTTGGSGCAVLVLKLADRAIEDRDHIHALIKGGAVNNDGSSKVSYTAPSVHGQAQVVSAALDAANISADSIGYIEAHGTGTRLGDPVEVRALTQAYTSALPNFTPGFCALGSLKSNIGHLDAASGVAGLVKAILAVQHDVLPASLNFTRANPEIDFNDSPFYVNTTSRPWPATASPRRAGVSSFGIGGTNAHVIVEEPPQPSVRPHDDSDCWYILPFSARTATALDHQRRQLITCLQNPVADIRDIAFTLGEGRTRFAFRDSVVSQSIAGALHALQTPSSTALMERRQDRPIVFMFSGQGSQYEGMFKGLYGSEAVFRQTVDRCTVILKRYGVDILASLYPPAGGDTANSLSRTEIAQPALFVVEYACALLLQSRGIHPQALIGHSLGELVAACFAGVYSLEDSLKLVVERGRLMQRQAPGAMLAVGLSEADCARFLGHGVELAAVNGPLQCVLAGDFEAIARVERQLAEEGLVGRVLDTSHAFHSRMMAPAAHALKAVVSGFSVQSPTIALVSNHNGGWFSIDSSSQSDYWASHLLDTVRFSDGIALLADELEDPIFLEIGPGRALQSALKSYAEPLCVLGCTRHARDSRSDEAALAEGIASLWRQGASFGWAQAAGCTDGARVPLPTYPFARDSHWIEAAGTVSSAQHKQPLFLHWQRVQGNRRQFRLSLSPQLWLVDEHRVFEGKPVLSGTGCVELVRNAYARMEGIELIELSDVYFPTPLVLEDEQASQSVLITFKDHTESTEFFLESVSDDGNAPQQHRMLHALGFIKRHNRERLVLKGLMQLQSDHTDCLADEVEHAALNTRLGLFGPRWKCFRSIWLGQDEGLALLELDQVFAADLERFALHPALLDMATGFLSIMENSTRRLPFHYQRLTIHAPLRSRLYSHARRVRSNVYDVQLFEVDNDGGIGALLAEVIGFTLRDERVAPDAQRTEPLDWCQVPAWRPALPPRGDSPLQGPWLVVTRGVAADNSILAALPPDSICIGDAGDSGATIATIARGDAQAYGQLFNTLATQDALPSQIIYMAGKTQLAEGEHAAITLFSDLMVLVQAYIPHAINTTVLSVVTEGACQVDDDEPVNSCVATLSGVVRTLTWELPQIRCRHFDLPLANAAENEMLLLQVLQHIDPDQASPLAPTLALRKQTLHEPCLRALQVSQPSLHFKEGGTYVVTGGLGGMGLALASHLAAKVKAVTLVLMSRSATVKDEVGQALQAMEQQGARIQHVAVDCADREAFTAALQQVRLQHGCISGAIHAAGVQASGLIQLSQANAWAQVMGSKVVGTDVLIEALRQEPVDFIFLCSSLASVLGGLGQADYAAANAYLDARAQACRQEGMPVVSLNWDAWAQAGMRVAYDSAHPEQAPIDDVRGLTNAEGCQLFELALAQNTAQIIVHKAQDLQQLIDQLQRGGATSAGRATPLFDSGAERVAPRNAVEQEVAQLWQELLGGDMPGVLDNFFDLGGHSLLGSQLISRIRSRFQQCLTLAEFLDEPTIERIARSLDSVAEDTPIDADEAAVRYCLVPVQRNGEGRPFFCLPGMGGNVNQVLGLAKAMGAQRPFYGLQCLGLDGKAEPHLSVEEMAEHYIRCMKSVQAHGPYLLGGHSLGGKVAYEIARLLEARGDQVGLLALFDSAAPPYTQMQVPTDAQVLGSLLSIFGHYFDKPIKLSREELQALEHLGDEEKIRYLKDTLESHGLLDARGDEGSIRGLFNVYKAAAAFGMRYDPPKVALDASLVLFRAVDSMPSGINLPEIRDTDAWGWELFSAAKVRTVDVSGDHFTCLSVHAQQIADVLIGQLAECDR